MGYYLNFQLLNLCFVSVYLHTILYEKQYYEYLFLIVNNHLRRMRFYQV